MEIAFLGSRTLHAHRQLLAGGERVALGKRALDVLSRLAEARGDVVTKDELMEAVWPGTIVEENALQAQVAALRKALGPDAARLKTIRGIGYRLDVDPLPPNDEPRNTASAVQSKPRQRPRALTASLAVGAVIAAGALAAVTLRPGAPDDTVRIDAVAASGGPQARLLARSLDGQIVNVLNESRIPTRSDDGGFALFAPPPDSWRLRGAALQDGARLAVDMRLEDVATGTVVWSKRFEGQATAADRLATEASVATARTLYVIEELNLQPGIRVDPETIALHIRGSQLVRGAQLGDEGTPRKVYEEVVARAPQLAHGHAVLALTLVAEGRRGVPERRAGLYAQARREAANAIGLSPAGAGPAYDALYQIVGDDSPPQLAKAEQWLLEGMRKAPGFAFLWMRECRFLTSVGRASDALTYCQHALAQHPFAEPIGHSYARALWSAGKQAEAMQAIARAARLAPDHAVTREVRFELAAFGGNSLDAARLLDDPATRPSSLDPEALPLFRRSLARPTSVPERHALATEFHRLGLTGDVPLDWAVLALASLGDSDRAFDLLGSSGLAPRVSIVGSSFLFHPATRPLRADPRFWTVAADLGLAQYWSATGKWPDMCGREIDPDSCKSEARRVLAAE